MQGRGQMRVVGQTVRERFHQPLQLTDAPVLRDQLIRYAWQDQEEVDPASVNLVVSRLCRKLTSHLPGVRIDTISRYGYRISIDLH